MKFTPEEFRHNAHHWLILHGRYVCVARVPKCPQCVIADLCEYPAKTKALPGMQRRARTCRCEARSARRRTAAQSLRAARAHGAARTAMFTPSRDEARRFLIDAWRKYRAAQPLSGLEQTAAQLIAMHPEYHAGARSVRHASGSRLPARAGRRQSVPASVAASGGRRAARDRPAARHRRAVRAAARPRAATSTPRCTRSSNASAKRCGRRSGPVPAPTPRVYLACLGDSAEPVSEV